VREFDEGTQSPELPGGVKEQDVRRIRGIFE